MALKNIGNQLREFRESRNLLKTSLLGEGMQPNMITKLESGRGNFSNFIKYLSLLNIGIEFYPITPFSQSLSLYSVGEKDHISYDKKTTICGTIITKEHELVRENANSLELNNSLKKRFLCKRCFDGHQRREEQKNLPLG